MTGTSKPNWLNSGHLELLRKAQQDLHDMLPLLDAAERCGVECDQYRQGHAYASDRIDRFINTFFPGELTPPSPSGVGPDASS